MRTHDELREDLREALEQSALSAHVELLMAKARPVFHAERLEGPPAPGASKLCGVADLPEGQPWPQHEHGPYEFVAQIDFAELDGADVGLPADGLLSVFVATEPAEAYFWQDPGYVRALYTPAGTPLVPTPAPDPSKAQLDARGPLEAYEAQMREYPLVKIGVPLRFHRGIELPRSLDQGEGWPLDDPNDWDARIEFAEEMEAIVAEVSPPTGEPGPDDDGPAGVLDPDSPIPGDDHVLGYPSVSSLAYDPTPKGDWLPLLGLWSHVDLGWCWHDGDFLHIAIERGKLAAADFSDLASDAG